MAFRCFSRPVGFARLYYILVIFICVFYFTNFVWKEFIFTFCISMCKHFMINAKVTICWLLSEFDNWWRRLLPVRWWRLRITADFLPSRIFICKEISELLSIKASWRLILIMRATSLVFLTLLFRLTFFITTLH